MKKVLFLFCMTMCMFSIKSLAQEVHGVETKKVCIKDCNPDGSLDGYFCENSYQYKNSPCGHIQWDYERRGNFEFIYPVVGFNFHNSNTISVSVEAELFDLENKVIDTKSFVLKPNESYIWKPLNGKCCSKYNYYVKYTAYKLQ